MGLCCAKKNFGQISENAVEQLQVPRNQRELTFATISLKERCTDWFTWCTSTVMMTNMKRNDILTTLSLWNYPILNKGSPPKKLYSVCFIIFTNNSWTPKRIFFWKLSKSWDCKRPFWLKLNHTTFPSLLGQQLMVPVLINPDLLLSQDGCSGRLFVTFTIPLTCTLQL